MNVLCDTVIIIILKSVPVYLQFMLGWYSYIMILYPGRCVAITTEKQNTELSSKKITDCSELTEGKAET